VLCAAATFVGATASSEVSAVCPPLDLSAPIVLFLVDQPVIERLTASEGRLSESRLWELYGNGQLKLSPVVIVAEPGPPPATIEAAWAWAAATLPEKIELYVDGVRAVATTNSAAARHAVARPGRFHVEARVFLSQGRVRTAVRDILVLDAGTIDSILQARWQTLKDAVRRRDLLAALECVHSSARERAESELREMFADPLASALGTIRLREITPGLASYITTAVQQGRHHAWEVRFLPDADGVWRIKSF